MLRPSLVVNEPDFNDNTAQMSDSRAFAEELSEILNRRRVYLEEKRLPALSEQFRIYHTAYRGIFNVLLKKGLVAEDPYKSAQRISDVALPTDTTFLEHERDEQLSIRLAEFDNQLDFLNNYSQFTFEYLDLKRLKVLAGLAGYIKWAQLTPTAAHPLTRALAQVLTKLRGGGDGLSLGIVTDNHNQLIKTANTIIRILREIGDFQRERYKLEVRERVLPQIELDPASTGDRQEQVLQAVRRAIAVHMPGRPYIGELVLEILDEEHGHDRQEARQAVLDRLRVEEETQQAGVQQELNTAVLFEALRTMAAGGRYIESAIHKQRDNYALLAARPQSLRERVRRWVERTIRQVKPSSALTIEYIDDKTSTVHHERIEFEPFCEEGLRRARLLGGVQSRMGAGYKKLQQAPERQVFRFANRQLEELFLLHRRLEALETYFRSELPREHRAKLRSAQQELEALHGYLIRANKKKHDYIARVEEAEQLRRLGAETR